MSSSGKPTHTISSMPPVFWIGIAALVLSVIAIISVIAVGTSSKVGPTGIAGLAGKDGKDGVTSTAKYVRYTVDTVTNPAGGGSVFIVPDTKSPAIDTNMPLSPALCHTLQRMANSKCHSLGFTPFRSHLHTDLKEELRRFHR